MLDYEICKKRKQFEEFVQGNLSVVDYTHNFVLLERYASTMTPELWVRCYVDGLKESYCMILGV